MPNDYDVLFAPRRPARRNYDDLITRHAQRVGLDPNLVRAVVQQESGGNPRAVSPKGAQGIGQLMPATAKRFGVTDPFDPEQNIRGATDYLKFLHDRFRGNRDLVLAGYNAGEGAVDRFGGIPPYRETRNYVQSINARLGQPPQQPSSPYDALFQSPGQTPPPSELNTANKPAKSPVTPTPAPSVPSKFARTPPVRAFGRLAASSSPRALALQRPREVEVIDAGNAVELDPETLQPRSAPAVQARRPGLLERAREALAPYVPGLVSIDTPGGVKTDVLRGAISGVTLGALGDPRTISREELLLNPQAEADAQARRLAGETATAVVPYAGAARVASKIPVLARAGRVAAAARTGTTFGGVEAARQGIRAARWEQVQPEEIAVSAAIGAAMGAIPGVNPGWKSRIVAAVGPQVAADVARGVPLETAATNAVTNLLFEGISGRPEAKAAPRKFYHRDFGEVVEAPSQQGAGRGRMRVVAKDGSEHVIRRAAMTGAGNQRAVPIREPQSGNEAAPERRGLVRRLNLTPEEQVQMRNELEPPQAELQPAPALLPDAILERNRELLSGPSFRAHLLEESISGNAGEGRAAVNAVVDKDGKIIALGNIQDFAPSIQNKLHSGEYKTVSFVVKGALSDNPQIERVVSPQTRADTPEDIRSSWFVDFEDPSRSTGNVPDDILTLAQARAASRRLRQDAPVERRVVPDAAVEAPVLTRAAKAHVNLERAARGAELLPDKPPAKSDAQLLEQARKANEVAPERPARLAREIISTPRALSDVETVQLDLHQQQLKNRHATLLREVADATDPAEISTRRSELAQIEDEFNLTEQAWRSSGTEKGRALRAQQVAINENYDLLSLTARAKAAKGRELTADERARYEQLAKDYETAIQQRDEALQKAADAEIQQQLKRVSRQRKRGESRAILDTEFAELQQQFAQARAEIKNVQASGLAGLDPEGKLTVLIAKMARNRARAGVTSAAQLVDEVYNAVRAQLPEITPRDIRDLISGYGIDPRPRQRSAASQQLAQMRKELRELSESEDIAAGRRLSRADRRRQGMLNKRINDLEQRLATGNFTQPTRQPIRYTRETAQLQRKVEELKAKFDRELYMAQRSTTGKIADVVVGVGSVPKTMLSMGDLSAVLRQGGYFAVTHPVLTARRVIPDMLRSFSDAGWRSVEAQIRSHPDYQTLRDAGVQFTGVDARDPRLTRREEIYLGGSVVDALAKGRANPLRLLKGMKDFSERTFVSFLDSQRLAVGAHQLNALRSMKLSPQELQQAVKFQAKLINIGTGRGELGRFGQHLPLLNVLGFSPRLLLSRVQLLNKMFNPVAWAQAPKGARQQMLIDNAKFLGFTALTLGMIRQSGLAEVDLDHESSDFLKIKVGNTRYDTLTGLQQPFRYFVRMALGSKARLTGDETYTDENLATITGGFLRSKANPPVGALTDFLQGGNPMTGEEWNTARELRRLVTPLPFQDFQEAVQQDGYMRGIVETLPVLVGVGTQTYQGAAEKPKTKAEKLARRMISRDLPRKFRTEEQIKLDTKRGQLRAASRRGEDVTAELGQLESQLTTGQERSITEARGRTRLQEDFNRLSPEEAATVYSVASTGERAVLRPLLERKARNIGNLPEDRMRKLAERLRSFGIEVRPRLRSDRPSRKSAR